MAVLFGCLLMAGCHSSKTVTAVPHASKQEIIEALSTYQIPYSFCESKGKIKINGVDAKLGGRMHLRMYRDSVVWLNFKKLTVEGARALIRKDSTYILYRLDDLYESGRTEDYVSSLRIHGQLVELQDLFVGHLYIPSAEESHYEARTYHELTFYDDQSRYTYFLDEGFSLRAIRIQDELREINIIVSGYDQSTHAFMNRKIIIHTFDQSKTEISIKLSSITFDIPKSMPFEIPDHYHRID